MDSHNPSRLSDLETAYNVPLDDAQLNAIGYLTVLWSQFEFLCEWAIYHLRNQTFNEGRRTTLPRDISKKLGTLKALGGDQLQDPHRAELIEICDRGLALAPMRNLAVHGNWWDHHERGETCAVSWFKVTPEERLAALPASELPALTAETAAIGVAMSRLLKKLGALFS
jgi:hypothetical protein